MSQADTISIHGVPAQTQGGTPSLLPGEACADALETIEFALVLDLVAAYAAGPLGKARVLGRRPAGDLAWVSVELARVGQVAGLFRRGDRLLAEAIPDVIRVLGRLRVEGSVLEGRELSDVRRVLVAARQVHADLRRVADDAPLAAQLDRQPLDPRIERRLEQSVDEDGTLLDSASPGLAAARRDVHAARARLLRKLESLLRGLDAGAATSDSGSCRPARG